jgi:hypothetical protein
MSRVGLVRGSGSADIGTHLNLMSPRAARPSVMEACPAGLLKALAKRLSRYVPAPACADLRLYSERWSCADADIG